MITNRCAATAGRCAGIADRWATIVLAAGLAVLGGGLSGCATQLAAQVTTFNQVADDPAALAGRRFSVVPDETQRGSLEFDSYAGMVRRALVGKGLIDAGAGSADILANLSYATTAIGSTVSGPAAASGSVGFGGGGFGIGIGFPIGGRGGDQAGYRHQLRVTLERIGTASRTAPADGAPAANVARVYEGTAVSEGPSASPAAVMPALVRALFAAFPGKSGETRWVEVPLEAPREESASSR
ncbi:MAG: hypothetical protein AB7G13_10920 [Lautropia sp.]